MSTDQASNQTNGGQSEDRMLKFFTYAHLPEHLQEISKPFGVMAEHLVAILPRNPERTVALRKLLEAKDAFVRAAIEAAPAGEGVWVSPVAHRGE